jgi:ubiquinone/menaquinone biosynthesis C-methylase UbiE
VTSDSAARFSADPRIRVFDRIAWIYGFLFHAQRLAFRRSLRTFLHRLDLPRKARILDIGCGTGAFVSVLAEMGHEIWAVDASPGMLATARRLLRQVGLNAQAVQVSEGDPLVGLDFPAQYFDLVLATHVVHGLQTAQRQRFYSEARRVSQSLVLFHDYSPRGFQGPGLIARVLEALERSDYRRFRRSGLRELRDLFAAVEVILTPTGSAWYLCRVRP